MNNKTVFCFDIDNTICITNGNDYKNSYPINKAIKKINELYEDGNIIKLFTARGTTSKIDWTELTKRQLEEWGLKYHELIMNIKPSFDIFIDDKAINANDWLKSINPKVGFIYKNNNNFNNKTLLFLKNAKEECDKLIVGLSTKDSYFEENKFLFSSIKYIDEIVDLASEDDLNFFLKNTKIDISFNDDSL